MCCGYCSRVRQKQVGPRVQYHCPLYGLMLCSRISSSGEGSIDFFLYTQGLLARCLQRSRPCSLGFWRIQVMVGPVVYIAPDP